MSLGINGCRRKGIKAMSTFALQKSFLRVLILDKKEIRVKFHKGTIIGSKTMN